MGKTRIEVAPQTLANALPLFELTGITITGSEACAGYIGLIVEGETVPDQEMSALCYFRRGDTVQILFEKRT